MRAQSSSRISSALRAAAVWVVASAWGATVASAAPRVDFNRDVRPVLSDNCFACHGPDSQKVKGGLRLDVRDKAVAPAKSGKSALVPGKPEESELVRRLDTTDADDHMPPADSHKTITPAQREMLVRWIREGAEYQGHWAYQPLVRPAAPAGPAAIDFLIQKRLSTTGLKPAPEADRRTLARRLHWDLLGLPATAEQVEEFVRDNAPGAYERLVERLLASPHYGERMAIGWLDVVRFADTIGYHSDTPRNIWPYRDYVIRSFNRNKPFDVFTREQLAGDLLPNPGIEQKVGSAFNRLLLTTEEGGAQSKDYESRYLTDRVRAVGAVWMGQTIGCAQCHDHKFDPISTRDFYSMGAFFADVKETIIGRREDGMLVTDEAQAKELEHRRSALASLEQRFEGPLPEFESAYQKWESQLTQSVTGDRRWTPVKPESAVSAGGATLKIRDDRSVLASGTKPDTDTYTVRLARSAETASLTGIRLEVLPDDSLPSKGPGRAGNGNFVVTEVVARLESAGGVARPLHFRGARATHEQTTLAENNPYKAWTAASAIDADAKGTNPGWAILPHVGRTHQLQLALDGAVEWKTDETLVVEIQQRHGDGHHTVGRFRLAVASDPAAVESAPVLPPAPELAALVAKPADQRDADQRTKLKKAFRAEAPELAALRGQVESARKSVTEYEGTIPRCLITERGDPRTVRVLPRGNWMVETGDVMEPALPATLSRGFAKPSRRLTRLDLADWIVSPENPLTARVVMNRMWKQFFGIGLSKVVDDLGAQGETPLHQPVLDWLACEFRSSGWDVKHMVRTLVLSEAYRRSSSVPREELVKDPDNRELARQGRWRVEAELVRDLALSFSGMLVPAIGGPSVLPYQPDGYWENLNFPVRTYPASVGADQYRRGLYTWWQRSYVHPAMLAFDAPTREECAAERSRSNIPQQALVLLNDPSYVEAARALAVRILREAPKSDDQRLDWAWRLALARHAAPDELMTLRGLLEKQSAEYRNDPGAVKAYLSTGVSPAPADLDPAELAAWTDIARAILNLHETITRS